MVKSLGLVIMLSMLVRINSSWLISSSGCGIALSLIVFKKELVNNSFILVAPSISYVLSPITIILFKSSVLNCCASSRKVYYFHISICLGNLASNLWRAEMISTFANSSTVCGSHLFDD